MSLTEFQENILNRIEKGETVFSPEGENMTVEKFQSFAQNCVELSESGYIQMSVIKENMSEHKYINRVYNCRIVE